MFKTFIAGILLGIAGAAAALYYIPVVDQAREQSMIVVHPNHGNTETFHVNVPSDRIMVGAADQAEPLPAELEWPGDLQFAATRAELFKIRNGKDAVVGVASRIAASDEVSGEIIEWVLHLPARGSAYVIMEPQPQEGGYRVGDLARGTREFSNLTGRVTERFVEAPTSFDENGSQGRIEIITAFVGQAVDDL
ncbi:MAG: hypothetical protein QNJ23_03000 [Woeseiaceae bacterium]|nr:hypothetical protein [Woeseiaceae bacterium]